MKTRKNVKEAWDVLQIPGKPHMTEPNICPQESGSRMDCTVASVTNGTIR